MRTEKQGNPPDFWKRQDRAHLLAVKMQPIPMGCLKSSAALRNSTSKVFNSWVIEERPPFTIMPFVYFLSPWELPFHFSKMFSIAFWSWGLRKHFTKRKFRCVCLWMVSVVGRKSILGRQCLGFQMHLPVVVPRLLKACRQSGKFLTQSLATALWRPHANQSKNEGPSSPARDHRSPSSLSLLRAEASRKDWCLLCKFGSGLVIMTARFKGQVKACHAPKEARKHGSRVRQGHGRSATLLRRESSRRC